MSWPFIFIGLVIWYFYSRFKKRNAIRHGQDSRYIRDDDFQTRNHHHDSSREDDDDYIDYEEVK